MEPNLISLDVRGAIIIDDPDNHGTDLKVVYQATSAQFANYWTKSGEPRMRRRYVVGTDPQSVAQLDRRAAMSAAVAAWHAATAEQRETARTLAHQRSITLFNAYISLQLKAWIPALGTVWDAGATTWDSGSTHWDT